MLLVVQSVEHAEVIIHDIGEKNTIGNGILVYFAIHKDDIIEKKYIAKVQKIVDKIGDMRWLKNDIGRLDATLHETNGSIMVISNFTLYANNEKGAKMSFSDSAAAVDAEPVYDFFITELKNAGFVVQTGKFGAMMEVSSTTLGPINYVWDL